MAAAIQEADIQNACLLAVCVGWHKLNHAFEEIVTFRRAAVA